MGTLYEQALSRKDQFWAGGFNISSCLFERVPSSRMERGHNVSHRNGALEASQGLIHPLSIHYVDPAITASNEHRNHAQSLGCTSALKGAAGISAGLLSMCAAWGPRPTPLPVPLASHRPDLFASPTQGLHGKAAPRLGPQRYRAGDRTRHQTRSARRALQRP